MVDSHAKALIPAVTMPLRERVAKNALSNGIQFVWVTGLTFVVTAYMVRRLGTERYGIWALSMGLVLFRLSNLGIDRALIKFVAAYWEKGDVHGVTELVNTALGLYITIGGIVCSLLLVIADLLVTTVFEIPVELQAEATFVIIGSVVVGLLDLVFSVFRSVLWGLQRMDITSLVIVVTRTIYAMGVFLVLERGYGLRGLVLNSAVMSLSSGAMMAYFSRRVWPGLRMNVGLFRAARIREILGFGAHIQAAEAILIFREPLTKALLSHYLSLEHVAFFDLATRIPTALYELFRAMAMAMLPAVSGLQAANNLLGAERLYARVVKGLFLVSLPVVALAVLLSRPVTAVWLGPGYRITAETMQVLTVGWSIGILAMPIYIVTQALGVPQVTTYGVSSGAVLNGLLSFLLVQAFGYPGLVLGVLLALCGESVLTVLMFRWFVPFSQSLRRVGGIVWSKAMTASLLLALPTYLVTQTQFAQANLWCTPLVAVGYASACALVIGLAEREWVSSISAGIQRAYSFRIKLQRNRKGHAS